MLGERAVVDGPAAERAEVCAAAGAPHLVAPAVLGDGDAAAGAGLGVEGAGRELHIDAVVVKGLFAVLNEGLPGMGI